MNLEIFNSVVWAIFFGIHLPNLVTSYVEYRSVKKEAQEAQEHLNQALQAELDARRKADALRR